MYPDTSHDATSSFRVVQRRFRRVRWLLLIGALVLYTTVQLAEQFVMDYFQVVLDDRTVDWILAMLIGVGFTIGITRWEDRWVAQIEVREAQHAAAERARMQLEAAQATARTIAHTLNQPLTIIRGVTELYRDTTPAERNDADLESILAEVDRAASLVQRLLEISRYQTIPYAGGAPMLDLSPPQ